MTKTLEPDRLEPHPKNEEIYGDSLDQSFIDRVEEHGIQSDVKATKESYFTDADWTIIGGHRRVSAAEEIGMSVDVQEVGPFDSPEDELETLLVDNDHRNASPAQEFREVEHWIEVYRESPKLETGSAVEEACTHVSFSTSTYYNAQRVKQAAEDGEWGQSSESLQSETIDVADHQWKLLEREETTIGAAYEEVKNAKKSAYNEKPSNDLPEDTRGGIGRESAKEKIEEEANYPVQASFEMKTRRLKQILTQVKLPVPLSEESGQIINIGVSQDQVDIWTTGVQDLRSHYTISKDLLEEVSLENNEPYFCPINLHDIQKYPNLLTGDSLEVQLRGKSEPTSAECLYSTGTSEDLYFYLDAVRDDDDNPETPSWLPSGYSE